MYYKAMCVCEYTTSVLSTVLSQRCYLQSDCASGDSFAVSSAKECCVETDNGMSYADDTGTCIISQCIGKLAWEICTID